METLSIGILTYNNSHQLLETLDSLSHPSHLSHIYEVLVVDNGSESKHLEQIKSFIRNNPAIAIRLIQSPRNNLGLARKIVVDNCHTELLAFVDSDCLVPINWASKMLTSYREIEKADPNIAGVAASNRLLPGTRFSDALNMALNHFLGHGGSPQAKAPQTVQKTDHLPTTNCLLNVSKVRRAGNFCESFARICEDVDLSLRLKKHSFELYFVPFNQVINHSADNFWQWSRRMFRFGYGQARITLTHQLRRHWPSLLALPVFLFSLATIFLSLYSPIFILPAYFYLTLVLTIAIWICFRQKRLTLISNVFSSFVLTHSCYILGYSIGLIRQFNWRKQLFFFFR